MDKHISLSPCPFCGSEDYYIAVTDNPFSYDTYSTTHCSKCHATGPFVAESYLEDEPKPTRDYMEAVAKEKWQTRPIEDDLRKRIAELERDFDMLFRAVIAASKQSRKNTQTQTIVYGKESEE